MQRTRTALPCLVAAVILAGCVHPPIAPGSDVLTPDPELHNTPLPTSPAGPLPEVVFSDLAVQAGGSEGEWNVFGMARNQSPTALGSVIVRVELVDPSGAPTREAAVSLPLSVLQPGAASPFTARLEQDRPPAGARASLDSFQYSPEDPVGVSVTNVYRAQAPDGVFVTGAVQDKDVPSIRVGEIVVTWRDSDRSLAGLAVATVPSAAVLQDESLPWIAWAPGADAAARFEVFASASAEDPASVSPLVMADGPTWHLTDQGSGFAAGAIRNDGGTPVFPQVSVAAYAAGRPISVEILRSGMPLEPGETLTFTADRFPGLQAALEAEGIKIANITLKAYLDALPVPADTGAAILLPVSIRQFEAIGSSVFLRGTVTGPASGPIKRAVILASLRSTTGEPLSARWLELSPPPAGAGVEFSIDMPLPAGVDAALCEYDVRALGLPLTDS